MNWPYVHLVLNHLPVLGVLFGLCTWAYSAYQKNDALRRWALITFVGAAVFTIPTYISGEKAEHAVEDILPARHDTIHEHEEVAELFRIPMAVLGVLSLIALCRRQRAHKLEVAVLLLAAIAFLVGLRTAHTGGHIRHTELTDTSHGHAEHEHDD